MTNQTSDLHRSTIALNLRFIDNAAAENFKASALYSAVPGDQTTFQAHTPTKKNSEKSARNSPTNPNRLSFSADVDLQ